MTTAIHCLPRQPLAEACGRSDCSRAELIMEGVAARYELPLKNVMWRTRLQGLVALAHTICVPVGGPAGAQVLDLGCGSRGGTLERDFPSPDPLAGRNYEPWLARILHELGAQVVGADLGDLSGEPYETLRCDLTVPGALASISDRTVDVVVITNFLRARIFERTVHRPVYGPRWGHCVLKYNVCYGQKGCFL